jgi:hypothetical protein
MASPYADDPDSEEGEEADLTRPLPGEDEGEADVSGGQALALPQPPAAPAVVLPVPVAAAPGAGTDTTAAPAPTPPTTPAATGKQLPADWGVPPGYTAADSGITDPLGGWQPPAPAAPATLTGEAEKGVMRGASLGYTALSMVNSGVAWAKEEFGGDSAANRQAAKDYMQRAADMRKAYEPTDKTFGAAMSKGFGATAAHLGGAVTEMFTDMVPLMAASGVATLTTGGAAAPVLMPMWFGILGAADAYQSSGGNPAATATGAAVGAATGVGLGYAVAKPVQDYLTKTIASYVVKNGAGALAKVGAVGGVSEAASYAQPLAGMAAGQGYTPPSAEDQAVNAITNVFGAFMGHSKAPEAKTSAADSTPPIDSAKAAAASAAVNEPLQLPPPSLANAPRPPDVINVPPEAGQAPVAPPPIYEPPKLAEAPAPPAVAIAPEVAAAIRPEMPPPEAAAGAPPPEAAPSRPAPAAPGVPPEEVAAVRQELPPAAPGVVPPEAPGAAPPRPLAAAAAVARPAAGIAPTPTGPGPQEETTPARFRGLYTEPDDATAGQHVAKNAAGDVVATGDTPEQALRFANQRANEAQAAPGAPIATTGESTRSRERLTPGAAAPALETPVSAPGAPEARGAPTPTPEVPTTPAPAAAAPKTVGEALAGRAPGAPVAPTVAKVKQAKAAAPEGFAPTVELPTMITRGMRQGLLDLGVSRDEIRNMTPAQAQARLAATAPPVRPAAAEAPAMMPGLMRKADVAAQQAAAKQRLAEAQARPAPTPQEAAPTAPLRYEPGAAPVEKRTLGDVAGVGREDQSRAEKLASTTTNRAEIGAALVHDLINDHPGMTIAKAADMYGSGPTGPGRPRVANDLHDYLQNHIQEAERAAAVDTSAMARITKAHQAESDMLAAKGETTSPRLQRLQDQAVKIADRANQREPLQSLYDIRDQLARHLGKTEVPSEAAPGAAAALAKSHERTTSAERPAPGAAAPEISRSPEQARADAIETLANPLINRATSVRAAAAQKGQVDSLHSYLKDDIIGSSIVRAAAPHQAALARWLEDTMNRHALDVQVMSLEKAGTTIHPDIPKVLGKSVGAYFGGDAHTIVIRPSARTNETVLHEGYHAITQAYINNIDTKIRTGVKLTAEEQRHYNAISSIMADVKRGIDGDPTVDPAARRRVEYSFSDPRGNELGTMALTSPEVQSWMAGRTTSPELRQTLNRLGYGIKPTDTLWTAFRRFVASVFHIPRGQDNLLEAVMTPLHDIGETGARFEEMYRARQQYMKDRGAEASAAPEDISQQISRSPEEERPTGGKGPVPTEGLPDARQRQAFSPAGETVRDNLDRKGTPAFVSDQAGKAISAIENKITDANLRSAARKAALPLESPETIDKMYGDKFPMVHDWVEAKRDGAQAVRDWNRKYQSRAEEINRQLRTDPANTIGRIQEGMAPFGTNTPRLGTSDFAANNSHITDKGLYDRAEAMDKALKASGMTDTYHAYKNLIGQMHAEIEAAKTASLIGHALPEFSADERASLADELGTKTGQDRLINNPDTSPVAQAMGERFQNNRELIQQMAQVRRTGWVNGDYLPLARYGDHMIEYGDRGTDNYGVERFEKRSEALARYKELQAQGVEPSQVRNINEFKRADAFTFSQMKAIDAAMARKGLSADAQKEVHDLLSGWILRNATQSAAARLQRKGILGASQDAPRTMLEEARIGGEQIGRLLHGQAESRAIDNMELRARELGRGNNMNDAQTARDLLGEMQKSRAPIDGDSGSALATAGRGLSRLSYVTMLLRPAKLVLNNLEDSMRSLASFSARHGQGRAMAALTKARLDMAPPGFRSGWNNMFKAMHGEMKASSWDEMPAMRSRLDQLKDLTPEDRQAIIAGADREGVFTHSQARMTRELTKKDGFDTKSALPARIMSNAMDMWASAEHAGDVMSRTGDYLAAYRLEKAANPTLSPKEWADGATSLVRRLTPNMDPWNRPRLATQRGLLKGFGPSASQFRVFGAQVYGKMAVLVHEIKQHGFDAEGQEAMRALGLHLGYNSLAVGLTGNVFGAMLSSALGLYDLASGKPEPHNYETDIRRWMREHLGPTWSMFLSRGILGVAGVDANRNIGLSNMAGLPSIQKFDAGSYAQAAGDLIGGPSFGTGQQMLQGMHELSQGNWQRAAMAMAPRALVRDPTKAYQGMEQGLTTPTGHVILPPAQMGVTSGILTGLGFNSTDRSLAYEERSAWIQHQQEVQADRSSVLQAAASGDFSKIAAYNADPAHRGSLVTYQQAAAARKQHFIEQRTLGLRVPAKQRAAFQQVTAL